MGLESKLFLTIVYILSSTAFAIYIVNSFRKKKRMGAIDYFNLYYLLVYFVVPIFFFYNSFVGFEKKYAVFLEYDFRYHIMAFLCAVIFIVFVNFFYHKLNIKMRIKSTVNVSTRKFLFINIIFI